MQGRRETGPPENKAEGTQRVPSDSRLYGKWIPAALVLMAGLTLVLIGLALAVLLGLVPVR